ncbi:MAG: cupin domain-containing protein [Clostridiales bacterium]|nr:cupin domain-containing protein [Clostridiales bacterium]
MSPVKNKKASGQLLGRAHCVQSLVGYQAGAVVSHEIIHRPTGTVSVFAFDKGQQLSEHTAPYDALVIIIDGEAEIRISGRRHRLAEDEMIIMPAHQPHALKAVKKFKMILVMVRS